MNWSLILLYLWRINSWRRFSCNMNCSWIRVDSFMIFGFWSIVLKMHNIIQFRCHIKVKFTSRNRSSMYSNRIICCSLIKSEWTWKYFKMFLICAQFAIVFFCFSYLQFRGQWNYENNKQVEKIDKSLISAKNWFKLILSKFQVYF